MDWVQVYDPLGQWLSPLVAGLPIVVLLGLLVLGTSAPRAAMSGLAVALAVAVWVFKMPASAAAAAAGYGACFGLMPIGWIVFSAVFLFHLTERSGQFEIVKRSVAAISPDRRVQALLIAFAFGAFLEGAAGFGAPVAITAALLIGIGFSPLYAAGLALIANTAPVAFGSLGIPIVTLAKVSGLDEMALSQMAGRQLPVFSLIIPAWLVVVMSGWKGLKGCWPAVLLCGTAFAGVQFLVSNYYGPTLVDILAGLCTMLAVVGLLRVWQPKEIWRFPEEEQHSVGFQVGEYGALPKKWHRGAGCHGCQEDGRLAICPTLRPRQIIHAWVPWLVMSLVVFLWGVGRTTLNGGDPEHPNALDGISVLSVEVPSLHNRVSRAYPVVEEEKPEPAVYVFNWLSAAGTGVFFAAVLAAVWLRIGLRGFFQQLFQTLYRVRWAMLTIACMFALANVTKYSGADATLGLAFTHTGWFYPLFAPLLGWLGVALTGSDTSCNALFGSLQRITAEQLGLPTTLIVASNSTGGVMGKMIDAQSIVVAATATNQSGGEGQILRFVFWHSLVLAFLMGLLTLAQAYWLTWMVP